MKRTANRFVARLLSTLAASLPALLASSAGMAAEPFHAYTLLGEQGRTIVRVVTGADACPPVELDGRRTLAMSARAAKEEIPARAEPGSKPAAFPVLSCELELPAGVRRASVAGQRLALPRMPPRRIVIIGDTGCRLKASAREFQGCADAQAWPFAQISRAAARLKPDLVLHLGDYHYRESPCPEAEKGCAGSPWGNGYDAWDADFFVPAEPLLRAAPWLVVRGNHESCARAGQGWFRFLDPRPYTAASSCNDPARDGDGDYSQPYAVPLGREDQFIVFDSARAAGRAYALGDEPFRRYEEQLRQVDVLAGQRRHSFFVSHHPVLGFTSAANEVALPGNAALQSVMTSLHPGRLFATGIDLAIHGHMHLFESLSFASDHPATIVVGNSGSSLYLPLPGILPEGAEPAPGARVAEFFSHDDFGFLVMERRGKRWHLTERDRQGRALLHCRLRQDKLHCTPSRKSSSRDLRVSRAAI